jgi:acyl-CoA dehydrogenase
MADRSFLSWPFFDDSHRQFVNQFQRWADSNLVGINGEDANDQSKRLVRKFASGGWLKHLIPAAYGGIREEFEIRTLCLGREILAYISGLADFAFTMQGLSSGPISLFGSAELKLKYLPLFASGAVIGAFAISEPDAGSDLHSMQTTARRDGDNYVISGTKTWISNAGIADLYVTFCRFPQLGPKAYVALAVPAASARVTVEPLKIIAPHPLGTVRFRDCAVERSALIGREGDGLKIALSCLDVFRAAVGAAALGFAKRAFDEAVSFSRMRKVFGQSLSEFQITQAKFADMALAIDTSALLVYRAAWISDVLKQPVTREAAMAKLHATEAAQQVIDQAVQILGARGVLAGSITEQLYREIRALRIYEGTSEIQKLIIAGQVLKAAAGESNAS